MRIIHIFVCYLSYSWQCLSHTVLDFSFQENHDVHVVMTNDDILGDEIPLDQQQTFRHFCYQMLKQNVVSTSILILGSF